MTIALSDLTAYLEHLFSPVAVSDYCPNGLQVAGSNSISTIVTGVSISQELISQAISIQAQAILVHHGLLWNREPLPIVGIKHRRLQALLAHNINLFAYHLPLDLHPQLGNNVQLAQLLGLEYIAELNTATKPNYGIICSLAPAQPIDRFIELVAHKLQRQPLHIAGGPELIQTVALATGAAQDYISYASAAGVDLYLSGEISERTTYQAREANIHYLAAGHAATERYGIQALGRHLSEQFQLQHHFCDIPNPV